MNRKILAIIAISVLALTITACTINNNIEENIENSSWEKIKTAIANCEVTEVFQAHSLDVSVNLKNGDILIGVEPGIDDILGLAEDAKEKCGDIAMATE